MKEGVGSSCSQLKKHYYYSAFFTKCQYIFIKIVFFPWHCVYAIWSVVGSLGSVALFLC